MTKIQIYYIFTDKKLFLKFKWTKNIFKNSFILDLACIIGYHQNGKIGKNLLIDTNYHFTTIFFFGEFNLNLKTTTI
jgi:hypothetical protein